MMRISGTVLIRVGFSAGSLLVIAASVVGYAAFVGRMPTPDAENTVLESNLKRLESETFTAKERRGAVLVPGASSAAETEKLASNALTFADPESMEAVLREASSNGFKRNPGVQWIEKLGTTASNELAARARKRRFESHQFLQKINEIDARLAIDPTNRDLQQKKDLFVRTRAILLAEYPSDTQRALAINPDNARAIYDLCRFMQDKVGSYDRQVIIRNFERLIEIRHGQSEKDGDFLNANINLTVLSYEIGNLKKARCYSAQTLEKHLARSQSDYDYMFGSQPDGRINEPEFRDVTNKVNPAWSMEHEDCSQIPL